MQNQILIIFLVFLLTGSWLFFVYVYFKRCHRNSASLKKSEEYKRLLQEECLWIDSVVGLLTSLYELEFANTMAEAKSLLTKKIVDFACQMLKCSAGSLMLVDKETDDLTVVAVNGISEESLRLARLKMGEGVAGYVAESGKTVIVGNIDSDVRFLKRKSVEYRSKSMISFPLKVKNRVVGVLNLHAVEPHHVFGEREIQIINLLNHQAAFAIENMDLQNNLQEFYLEMVEIFTHALEMKEHVVTNRFVHERVRIYARKIAAALDLPESITRHVEFAFLMHGIGKFGIDDAILRKPTKLTAEEYEQMKKHPEIGQKMISQVRFLSPCTTMVLYHQERWDGKGYPAGLRGEEIPLGARIVAVLNAYSAMTSDRPYRKALPESEAVEELKRGSGIQFDPKVVEAFIEVLKKEKEGKSEYKNDDVGKAVRFSSFRESADRLRK